MRLQSINHKKLILSYWLRFFKIDLLLLLLQKKVYSNEFIRAINYHDTAQKNNEIFEKQLRFYKAHFDDVTLSDLDNFFYTKKWPKDKPGLIIAFDDGLKTNYDNAAPLLEKHGFTGWFFIPTDFINCPPQRQKDFAKENRIYYSWEDIKTGRISMSWEEIRDLEKRGHIICSHTKTHYKMMPASPVEKIKEEIYESKNILEGKLDHEIKVFGWVIGKEEINYPVVAASLVSKSGYKYAFMTNSNVILSDSNKLQLQKTNVESSWPLYLITFQISGLVDLYYYRKRRNVNKLTAI